MPTHPIDLRSDTVSRPTAAMRAAIAAAVVGDDVMGDDPTVIALQDRIAAIMGKEAAVFVPTGTMANQTAIRAHTEPGDEIICHQDSHIIHYETGGPAALSGVMIRTASSANGQFDVDQLDALVRPESQHSARSRLLIIENTHNRCGGSVWPIDLVRRVTDRARQHGLRTHLDGARIWNACAATGLKPADYAKHFDTISCCFSKGLGTPAGSAVVGDKATMTRVHRFRKMFGGTMRQSGILAAAALYALDHHVQRLGDDAAHARRLADGLARIPGLSLAFPVETNMVFVDVDPRLGSAADVCAKLKAAGVLALPNTPRRIRLVCHLDVNTAQIDQAVRTFQDVLAPAPVGAA